MKTIPVGTLKAGSTLTEGLYLDENFILLTSDTPVTDSLIRRLREWHYNQVLLPEGASLKTVSENLTADAPVSLNDSLEEVKSKEETQKFYTSILEYTQKTHSTFLQKNIIGIESLTEAVKALMGEYKKNRRFLLRLEDLDATGFSYITRHSVNVAILAIAIGDSMKLPSHKMIELGMTGLLHEIGMFRLPGNFQDANRALTDPEKRALTAHPLLGYRVLKDFGFSPNVTLAVLEHHEKEDGTGYPQKLTGDKIAMSAKIIAVAGAYDAQISERPYRSARNGHFSLMELLKEVRKSYDEQILKRLIFALGLFPIGSYVELNEGNLAMVYDTSFQDPKRPSIKILTDEKKNPLADYPIVSLTEKQNLSIVRVLNSDEVRQRRAEKLIPL